MFKIQTFTVALVNLEPYALMLLKRVLVEIRQD